MTAAANNIIFVGPMGSGKSTIGRRVASALEMQFVDCDHELERRLGVEVGLIFDIEGETGFRERERRMLAELCNGENTVIATGGGVVVSARNRELIRDNGFVVYLETPVNQQINRLYMDKKRPLLQTADRRQKLEALAQQRNPLYEEVADLTIQSTQRSLPAMTRVVCKMILEHWPRITGTQFNENS